jgi:DNA-binding MarR family transcriptional regulator
MGASSIALAAEWRSRRKKRSQLASQLAVLYVYAYNLAMTGTSVAKSSSLGPLPSGAGRREFLERQPTYWLKRCYQALRRTVDTELRSYGVTLSQRDVLLALYEEGPLSQTALRERLGLEQSSVSRVVEGLVRRGLVALQTGTEDRRVRNATLTDAGQDLLLRTPGSSALAGGLMTNGMSEKERRDLIRFLEICTDNLSGPAMRRSVEKTAGTAGEGT